MVDVIYACLMMHDVVLKDEEGENLEDLTNVSSSTIHAPCRVSNAPR